jgi:hypothetical protein
MSERALRRDVASRPRFAGAVSSLVLFAGAFVACASQHGVTQLADGSYRVACEQPLLSCLEPAAKACELYGYDVENASEQRSRYGPNPWQAELVKSSATVRCRQADPAFRLLGGVGSKPGAAPSASAPPAPTVAAPPPAPACVPGTSQACASSTGCTGAQVCGADGRSFGPCECAAAVPAPVAPAPAAPAGSAQPAPAPPAPPAASGPGKP